MQEIENSSEDFNKIAKNISPLDDTFIVLEDGDDYNKQQNVQKK